MPCGRSLLPIQRHLISIASWTTEADIEVGPIRQICAGQCSAKGTCKADAALIKADVRDKQQTGGVIAGNLIGKKPIVCPPLSYRNDLSVTLDSQGTQGGSAARR